MSDAIGDVGVVGAGTMGAGIAHVAAGAGHVVRLYDVADGPLAAGLSWIESFVDKGVSRGKLSPEGAGALLGRISGTTDLGDLGGAAIVIEAAPERLDLKQDLFRTLEAIVRTDAILASNTSTLPIAAIFGGVDHPGRACGLHFFNPAPLMPLVEVIRGPATTADTIATVMALARTWDKQPVEAADTPGFIVNRVARPFYGEALRLLGDQAATVEVIDRLARDASFPMGPFELMDLIGIDVNFAAATSVFEGFFGEPRFRPHPIQRAMVDSGRLGRKTGRGYYRYDGDAS